MMCRNVVAAFGVAITCVMVTAGCGGQARVSTGSTTTPTMILRPLVERELAGLLLSAPQVNAAMGATAMTVTHDQSVMSDNSATMAPPACLPLDGAAEAVVYAHSGSRAERDQTLNDGNKFAHYLKQAVVLFPTIEKASAFLDVSAHQWPACRQYIHLQSGTHWSVGPISTVGGALSTTTTEQHAAAPGWGCGRALAQRNNVVIDVNTCSATPADSASRIALQIAANVTARW